jgi:WD40 repeat protein
LYSAGSEGVIRVWRIPEQQRNEESKTDGRNECLGVFSSHKDVVWQLVYHPHDNMLLSVSADASVKLWKSYEHAQEVAGQCFESIEQTTNHFLMGSFIQRRESGVCEVPTSASWIKSYSNMLVIAYRNPLICLFDRVTVKRHLFLHLMSRAGAKAKFSCQ